jgi:hypothetical protein
MEFFDRWEMRSPYASRRGLRGNFARRAEEAEAEGKTAMELCSQGHPKCNLGTRGTGESPSRFD